MKRGKVFLTYDSKNNKNKANLEIKSFINNYGYVEYVLLNKDGVRKHIQQHRLVASMFIPNPENKPQVNHMDGDKLNNSIDNLEWVTPSENEIHSYHVLNKTVWNKGLKPSKEVGYIGKSRTVYCLDLDNNIIKEYFNPKAAENDGFSLKQISAVCMGRQKTHKGFNWRYKDEV